MRIGNVNAEKLLVLYNNNTNGGDFMASEQRYGLIL